MKMIDPLKPIGAFLENTIRPLLAEFQWFFKECEKKGISLNEENIQRVVRAIGLCHFRTVIIHLIQNVVITLLICATWLISKG